jgi:hypothetical protein
LLARNPAPASVAHRGVDRYPIAAGDHDPGALSGEGLGGGKADPAITAAFRDTLVKCSGIP